MFCFCFCSLALKKQPLFVCSHLVFLKRFHTADCLNLRFSNAPTKHPPSLSHRLPYFRKGFLSKMARRGELGEHHVLKLQNIASMGKKLCVFMLFMQMRNTSPIINTGHIAMRASPGFETCSQWAGAEQQKNSQWVKIRYGDSAMPTNGDAERKQMCKHREEVN